MLKIFREDVNLENLESLLSEVKEDVIDSLKHKALAKKLFENCFVCNGSTLDEEVSKLIGEIIDDTEDDTEFIFEENTTFTEKFKSYHILVLYLDCLKNLATVDETKEITRPKFNEAQQFFLNFREFIQENVTCSQITNCSFLKTFDLEIENDSLLENKPRFKKEEKSELFKKIKSIKNELNPLLVACEQLNKIFSYSKNISNKRGTLAASIRLKTCPYCNINNLDIIQVDLSGGEKKISAKCELDHVLPQAQFPLFESSFWNLVPICHTCNHNKLEDEIHFNSWFISISNDIATIDLEYDRSSEVREMIIPWFKDLKNEEITFHSQNEQITNDINKLQLKQLYNQRYKSQGELGDLGISMRQVFLGLKDLRKARVTDLAELLNRTESDCLDDLFSHYFRISFSDYKANHYSRVLYGKIISEFIRGKAIDKAIDSLNK